MRYRPVSKFVALLLTCAAALTLLPSQTDADLVLHSTMDDGDVNRAAVNPPPALNTNDGDWTIQDTAGTAQNGTANSVNTGGQVISSAIGKIQQATRFSTAVGGNRHVSYGNVHNVGTGSYTVSSWINAEDANALQYVINNGNNDNSGETGYSMFIQNGVINLRTRNTLGERNQVSRTLTGDTNEWHLFTLTIDNTAGMTTGYFDGQSSGAAGSSNGWTPGFDGVTFTPGSNFTNTEDLLLAIRPALDLEYKGLLDDFAIWDEALNEAEATSLFTLADESALNYNASQAQALFDVFDTGVMDNVGGQDWFLTNNGTLMGNPGDVLDLGNGNFALILDASGNGVTTLIPEPASILLWTLLGGATALVGWRRRRALR